MSTPIITIKGLKNYLGNQWVHSNVNLTVNKGEIIAIIGSSGSGKTTILRNILMLLQPTAGSIHIFGKDLKTITEQEANTIKHRWGMLFQHSALFSALTVLENIMFPMEEAGLTLDKNLMQSLALLKIALVGLPIDSANKFPAELSGGMQKRAATARAIAMDPELLILDEPTSGLDPLGARKFDDLIIFLRDTLNLTIIIISHDIESLKRTDRVAFVGNGEILSVQPFQELIHNKHPLIVEYFSHETCN